jgi:hypothetical protein
MVGVATAVKSERCLPPDHGYLDFSSILYNNTRVERVPLVARFGVFCWHSAFFLCRVHPRELYLNPRQAIRTQQQRQFPGVGQVMVEETPDRLPDRYLLLGDSVGG